jgi:hypothetical protein
MTEASIVAAETSLDTGEVGPFLADVRVRIHDQKFKRDDERSVRI